MLKVLLETRASVRDFSEREIKQEIIHEILEAGRLSPSGGNEQAWKFGVITDRLMIEEIVEIAYGQKWIKKSPLLIVMVTQIVEEEKGGMFIQHARFPQIKEQVEAMDRDIYAYLNMEEHQTKIAGTHMALTAQEHGIGSTWISYFNVLKLQSYLRLPKNLIPSEILAFGYPEKEQRVRTKKKLEEIVFYNKYKEGV